MTIETARRAAEYGLRGPAEWKEQVAQKAAEQDCSVWHAASLIDGLLCHCSPCMRERGALSDVR